MVNETRAYHVDLGKVRRADNADDLFELAEEKHFLGAVCSGPYVQQVCGVRTMVDHALCTTELERVGSFSMNCTTQYDSCGWNSASDFALWRGSKTCV